jgi:hypothetical protein
VERLYRNRAEGNRTRRMETGYRRDLRSNSCEELLCLFMSNGSSSRASKKNKDGNVMNEVDAMVVTEFGLFCSSHVFTRVEVLDSVLRSSG